MSDGDVPVNLLGRRLYMLDLDAAAERYLPSWSVADRLHQAISASLSNHAILFMDDLYRWMRADAPSAEAATVLKWAVTRANLQVIGTATPSQYHKYVGPEGERDWSIQTLELGETTPELTVEILQSVKVDYERHHHVAISDEAVQYAV